MRLAHNVAWELVNKEKIPEGMQINHYCDNPLCVNPFHLCLGTQAQNIDQAVKTGRVGNTDTPLVPIRLFLPVKIRRILAQLRRIVTGAEKRS
jgi:hypothetical protein